MVQPFYPVRYRGEVIGDLVPDLIVDDAVIIDSKVVSAFNETHIAQMLVYLNITGLLLALLLNFKNASLSWKRIVGPNAKDATPPDCRAQTHPCNPCNPWLETLSHDPRKILRLS